MRCYCCGKELKNESEFSVGWHSRCIKNFFGTNTMPEISIDENLLDELANKSVNKGLTVPGVQKKLSLHLERGQRKARFTLVDHPSGYILKPPSADYEQLPEAEHLAMSLAQATGISVVPFALIKSENSYAYITKRVDRKDNAKLAMEDFCQLSGRCTADKYKGSYEECGRIIKKYSDRCGLDLTELFLRLVFCDVIGNSDMHLKNFSLIETEPASRKYVLSPAYDLLPVNIIMPSDKDFTALTLNGKKSNLRRKDFLILANNLGLSDKAATNIIESVLKKEPTYEQMIRESNLSDSYKENLCVLMEGRMELLTSFSADPITASMS